MPLFKLGFLAAVCALAATAQQVAIAGRTLDPQGRPVPGAAIRVSSLSGKTVAAVSADSDGRFTVPGVPAGSYLLTANAPGFAALGQRVNTAAGESVTLRFTTLATRNESVTVSSAVAELDIDHPDPSQKFSTPIPAVLARRSPFPASPSKPPQAASKPRSTSLPESRATAANRSPPSGKSAAILPRITLSSNAHGNGYSDPNIIVPALIEAVASDGGAFNVREGNHSVNAAETYSFHSRLEPFVTLTGDQRDLDLTAGWNWIAIEAAYGNGFLDRLEHRQQYKINALHAWRIGRHELALFGIGYFGRSMIPGLVPVGVPDLNDTIDPRQKDETHTTELVLNDAWTISSAAQLQSSAFFRTCSLALYSNFGDGLIRQSEFRTEQGGNETWTRKISNSLSLMAGLDYFRDAPRRLDLDHYLSDDASYYGPFEKVTANNVTLNFLTPFIAVEGNPFRWLRYNLGWRRDQIDIANQDLMHPANSSQAWVGVNSPKATLSLIPPERSLLPTISFSFGQAFFTNDPRIGDGTREGTRISRAHSYQLVVSRYVGATELRATLGHLTQEASLAKVDPDTGLQEDEGPSRNLYITLAVRRHFSASGFEASFSKADARDLTDGTPVPEAPRLIADAVGTIDRLPWRLRARGEFEYVGAKPLGDGFTGVPVREFRGALVRPFLNDRLAAGVTFLLASGYTGQTTEVLALPGEAEPLERVVGVYLPSYATLSFTYRFLPRRAP